MAFFPKCSSVNALSLLILIKSTNNDSAENQIQLHSLSICSASESLMGQVQICKYHALCWQPISLRSRLSDKNATFTL